MPAFNPGVQGFPNQPTSSGWGNNGPWSGGGGSGWGSPPPQESGLDKTLRLIMEGVIIPTAAMAAGALVQRAIFGGPPEMPSFSMPSPPPPQAQAPVIPEQQPTVQGVGAKAAEAEARARTVDQRRRKKKGRRGTQVIGGPLGAPLTAGGGVQKLGQSGRP